MTDEQLAAMEAGAPLLVSEYRKLQEEYHITGIDKDLCIQDIHNLEAKVQSLEKRAVEAEHAAALWMKRAKEMEASYEDLRLRYAQQKPLLHYANVPFHPICGVDGSGQTTTGSRTAVTCPNCLRKIG